MAFSLSDVTTAIGVTDETIVLHPKRNIKSTGEQSRYACAGLRRPSAATAGRLGLRTARRAVGPVSTVASGTRTNGRRDRMQEVHSARSIQ
jgi:hypothetical protein